MKLMVGSGACSQFDGRGLRGARVLVVDDDDLGRRTMVRTLQVHGAHVGEAAGGREAIEAVGREPLDVVLCDLVMPDADGIEVLRAIRDRDLDVSVVLMTGLPDFHTAVAALRLGAMDYLTKPEANGHLCEVVARAATAGRLARARREALAAGGRPGPDARDSVELGHAFDRALDTLWMAFQPIVRRDGTLYGYEALMRTREETLPHPGAVLDAAERLGRTGEVGRRTRELTASSVGRAAEGTTIFLNLHAVDLADPDLRRDDTPIALAAQRIVLEVTERASLERVENLSGAVGALRRRGFRIALDDLGAGYAGLTAFAQLVPDVAKLDMSLVRGVDADERRAKVVRAITDLCHDLKVLVVAEGVETVAERDALLDLDCDLFQGFLIARPGAPFPVPVWPAAEKGRQLSLRPPVEGPT
ncbi:MAG: EAL domain-containing response regulator [Deltaproteobacteria bacterium]|nr:EAL domain-containing response regulator [Deltaproteobacteria bacterium]